MPIVSQSILKDQAQADGRRIIIFLFTDDLGNDIIFHRGRVPSDFDADAELLAYVDKMDNILISIELENAISKVESGEDSLTVTNAFHHSTQKETAKKLIRYMIKIKSVYFVLAMESLVEYIKTNYNNGQILTFLDITSDQLITLNSKYNSIITNKTDILAADIQEDWF